MDAAANYGIAGLALGVAFAAMKFVDRFIDKRDARKNGHKIDCPNKVHDLALTLRQIDSTVKKAAAKAMDVHAHTEMLVEWHRPGPDGIQSWKVPPRMIELLETAVERQSQFYSEIHPAIKKQTEIIQDLTLLLSKFQKTIDTYRNGSK